MRKFIKPIMIKNRIFFIDDFHKLAALLIIENDQNPNDIQFSVIFSDGEVIEDDRETIFDIDQINAKKVSKISMEYHSPRYVNNIDIEIEASFLTWSKSRIIIKSEDETWYLRVRELFANRLDSIKKQKYIVRCFPNMIAVLLGGAGLSFAFMYFAQLFLKLSSNLSTQAINMITYVVGVLGYSIPILIVLANPKIEFGFGASAPPKWCEIIVKCILGTVFTGILLPVIIGHVF
jgi:hypothetical protein